jgi:hypothetical protein
MTYCSGSEKHGALRPSVGNSGVSTNIFPNTLVSPVSVVIPPLLQSLLLSLLWQIRFIIGHITTDYSLNSPFKNKINKTGNVRMT